MTTATAAVVDEIVVPRRLVPAVGSPALRGAFGALAALAGPFAIAAWQGGERPGLLALATAFLGAWLPAVWLTDKYRHKYPYRYLTYLLASHGKAAVIMALALAASALVLPAGVAADATIGMGLAAAALFDLLLELPWVERAATPPAGRAAAGGTTGATVPEAAALREVDRDGVLASIDGAVGPVVLEFLRDAIPAPEGAEARTGAALVIDDRESLGPAAGREALGLLVGERSLNAVRRLNLYLQDVASSVAMGGYLAVRYVPLEIATEALRARVPRWLFRPAYLLHFVRYRAIPKIPWLDVLYFSRPFRWLDRLFYRPQRGRQRALSRSEVWGRLAYFGFEVVREHPEPAECLILARRTSPPVANRRPSYYMIVALEKVGLDGEVIRLFKVRSMFPFSEFLQKRIFESHGLSTTGKFKNDFRLTEYGPLIRRSWLDELPGIYNWLRGDIKLVGMRATSPHFLGLYPKEVYDRYVVVKPGLVPPIFDEKTAGFAEIVETEATYLRRYLRSPIATDIAYFWYTFRDIVIRRVRSH